MTSYAFYISNIQIFYLYVILTSELRHIKISLFILDVETKIPPVPNLSKIKPIPAKYTSSVIEASFLGSG